MAENLIDLRRRIKSVNNTQKSTRAMKTVSAAKLRRSVMELNKTKPMMEKIESLLKRLAKTVDIESHPLLTEREKGKTLIVAVSADKGLCGAFNSRVVEAAEAHYEKGLNKSRDNRLLVTVGNKAYNYFNKRNFPIIKELRGKMMRLKYQDALDLSEFLQDIYLNPQEYLKEGEQIKKIEFVYTEYQSASRQETTIKQLFPIESEWGDAETNEVPSVKEEEEIEYIFEPSEEAIFRYLLPKYINSMVFQVLLQSSASEHAARMIAMEMATQNATEMIRALTLTMNKLRQASITNELLEIITATEALKK